MEKTSLRKFLIIFVIVCLFSAVSAAITFAKAPSVMAKTLRNVYDEAELNLALANAQPGDLIMLYPKTDGTSYTGHFFINVSGTQSDPITLEGSSNIILDGNGDGYVLHLDHANYWHLIGFTITNGKKGIMTDYANHNLIEGVLVYNTVQEGIHFRNFSSYNTVQDSVIRANGTHVNGNPTDAGFGEGIYIGSAVSNWATVTGGTPDASDYNRIIGNHIGPDVMAEAVDVKEGTTGGEVSGNCFDHAGISGVNAADSWVDVKGNNYQINNNIGINTRTDKFLDGFQTHIEVDGWGNNNTFHLNQAYVYATGYAINIKKYSTAVNAYSAGNIVYDDNTAIGADGGLSNVTPVASGLTGTPMPTPNCPTSTPVVTEATATATFTFTETPTSSLTPTASQTPTVTRTNTNVPTPTLSATRTPTLTPYIPTLTVTQPLTVTVTASNTIIPTQVIFTPTPTPTLGQAITATRTPIKVVATFQSSAAQDGWILESTETSSVGGTLNATSTTFRLGDDATDRQYISILHFDTSSLPDTAIIDSVTLKIKRLTSAGTLGNPFNLLGYLRVDIRKPFFGTTTSLALEDFAAAATSTTVGTIGAKPLTGAWYGTTLNTAGNTNINLTGATQFRLRFSLGDNDNLTADYYGFYSGNTAAISDRPQLTITYYLP